MSEGLLLGCFDGPASAEHELEIRISSNSLAYLEHVGNVAEVVGIMRDWF